MLKISILALTVICLGVGCSNNGSSSNKPSEPNYSALIADGIHPAHTNYTKTQGKFIVEEKLPELDERAGSRDAQYGDACHKTAKLGIDPRLKNGMTIDMQNSDSTFGKSRSGTIQMEIASLDKNSFVVQTRLASGDMDAFLGFGSLAPSVIGDNSNCVGEYCIFLRGVLDTNSSLTDILDFKGYEIRNRTYENTSTPIMSEPYAFKGKYKMANGLVVDAVESSVLSIIVVDHEGDNQIEGYEEEMTIRTWDLPHYNHLLASGDCSTILVSSDTIARNNDQIIHQTTSEITGISEQKPQSPFFKMAYASPGDGLRWSKALPGVYSNGCVDDKDHPDESKCAYDLDYVGSYNGKPIAGGNNSNAAKACASIGGRLPSRDEFETLLRRMNRQEYTMSPQPTKLTKSGFAEMKKIFGDMGDKAFWTSSIASTSTTETPDHIDSAFHFDLKTGDIYSVDNNRHDKYSVLCVQ